MGCIKLRHWKLIRPMPVLYRTYRPQKWSEVIGQDEVVGVLKESIAKDHVSHAYLFSGGRGTGKTSVARILAKSLETADEDVYEIDAASNRGIDDIRHLREHVAVLPFSSKWKVYIIDEVHMLSKDAWNALLKTLEEPPKHVIFVLATTELDKVPDTIISRCQSFTFKRPTRDIIRMQVTAVAKKEGVALDSGAADLIAVLGDGSFRDALGILEKVISAGFDSVAAKGSAAGHTTGGKSISRSTVESITGAPRSELVNAFVSAYVSGDKDAAISAIGKAEDAQVSMRLFGELILEKMRFIFLVQNSPASLPRVRARVSADDMKFIEAEVAKAKLAVDMLRALVIAVDDSRRAFIESLPLEMACAIL